MVRPAPLQAGSVVLPAFVRDEAALTAYHAALDELAAANGVDVPTLSPSASPSPSPSTAGGATVKVAEAAEAHARNGRGGDACAPCA